MIPVVSPEQMTVIDSAAPESLQTLIGRAAWAVAVEARKMLGNTYGRRAWVLAGPGNNGADGREAARILERWGVRCRVFDALDPIPRPPGREHPDLVIDAAFGTGLTRPFNPPDLPAVPVLAVDIPSGVNGLTGERLGEPLAADRTVTFGAHKPGLLFGDGRQLSGVVSLAGLGLDCSATRTRLVTDQDLGAWPTRATDAHKWKAAVRIVAGDRGMSGATSLVVRGAFAAGATYVAVVGENGALPLEAVQTPLPDRWGETVEFTSNRFAALVVGPGMDPDDDGAFEQLAELLPVGRPLVLDGGALAHLRQAKKAVLHRTEPTVLTPHDGEFERLMGRRPGSDRIAESRALASEYGCIALLKGPTTCVADPEGNVRLVTAGDQRLATAGSGDVLSGVVAAGLATGLAALDAAALAAHLHGAAGSAGPVSLTAGMIPGLVGEVLETIV
jgi:NAD(P)H-hydrate epimerase